MNAAMEGADDVMDIDPIAQLNVENASSSLDALSQPGDSSLVTGAFNYHVTAHRPTQVLFSIVGSFTGPFHINLILAKSSIVEVHKLTANGLELALELPIFGRITSIELFRPRGKLQDNLFILVEKYKLCVLEYDTATGDVVTRAHGDVRDNIGAACDNGQIASLDPEGRAIAMHLYSGLVKVIPLGERGRLLDAFNARIDELDLIDMTFLHGYDQPTLVILYNDIKGGVHVKTYVVSALSDKELLEGPWSVLNVDPSSHSLIPVPLPLGGALVASDRHVVYVNHAPNDALESSVLTAPLNHSGGKNGAMKVARVHSSLTSQPATLTAMGGIDPEGSRFLVGDMNGDLFLILLSKDPTSEDGEAKREVGGSGRVAGVKVEPIGRTSVPSTISYLDHGYVFIGSKAGDSQLVKLHADVFDPVNYPNSYVEVIESYLNLGPIVDFCILDPEGQGQGQIVTCSGMDQDGSLCIVRNGIGLDEEAALELRGIKGLWSLRPSFEDKHDRYLILSFVNETRVLSLNEEEEMEEIDAPGFEKRSRTLHCSEMCLVTVPSQPSTIDEAKAEVLLGLCIQVTPASVRLVPTLDQDRSHLPLLSSIDEWTPSSAHGSIIHVAASSPSQVLLATGSRGDTLVLLNQGPSTTDRVYYLTEASTLTLESQVSCIDLTPISSSSQHQAQLAVVGTWDLKIHLISLSWAGGQSMELVHTIELGGEVIPRSLLLHCFEGLPHPSLLAGLGDGQMITWKVDLSQPASQCVQDRKNIVLGTKAITLKAFRAHDAAKQGADKDEEAPAAAGFFHHNVFAGCDRPTVIYSNNKKIVFSNINENEVSLVASFHCKPFPFCMAIGRNTPSESLAVVTMEDIQKLHVRKVKIHEQPRRVIYQDGTRTFGVITKSPVPISSRNMDPGPSSSKKAKKMEEGGGGGWMDQYYLRIFDDSSHQVCASFQLHPHESGISLNTLTTGQASAEEHLYVMGTAFIKDGEAEPSKGRILLFQYEPDARRLVLVGEKQVKGAVYQVLPFQGMILASVNAKVQIYKTLAGGAEADQGAERGLRLASSIEEGGTAMVVTQEGVGGEGGSSTLNPAPPPLAAASRELRLVCSHTCHIVSLYLAARGDFIIVGDLMRSVSVLVYKPLEQKLEMRASDYNTQWTTAIEMINDDVFVAAENNGNLYVLRKNGEAATDEERSRLDVVGEFYLGSFVNRLRKGSLVMKLPRDSQVASFPTLIFATVEGSIGLLASLPKPWYDWLARLQEAARKVIKGVGGWDHSSYRAFSNDRRVPSLLIPGVGHNAEMDTMSKGFIDGDLVESVLDLPRDKQEQVAALMLVGGPNPPLHPDACKLDYIINKLEELSQGLH